MRRVLLVIALLGSAGFLYADSTHVMFLGDTYFGESYQENPLYNRSENAITKFGYDYFFENVKPSLLDASFVFANLETPLIDNYITLPHAKWDYIHHGSQAGTATFLSKYNIKYVNLANNHIFDYGFAGYDSTVSTLSRYGINSAGAGRDERSSSIPFKISINSAQNVYVICCYWYRPKFAEIDYYASGNNGGVNLLDTQKIAAEVSEIRKSDVDAFVILYPHWGSNYKQRSGYQRKLAHKLIDSGVDMIIGQGAHTVQEIEEYNGKWIVYNIGNFIFNAPGRYELSGAKPYGLMAELRFEGNRKYLRLYPVFTNNLQSHYQLLPLDSVEFDDCYNWILKDRSINGEVKKVESKYYEIELK